jgi:hypothetical protein
MTLDKSTGGVALHRLLAASLFPLFGAAAQAQQITGVPGSPSATESISGEQLPPLPPKFKGKIERNAAQSKPYWPPRVEPPKGAPNVLLIMTDDRVSAHLLPSTALLRHRHSIASLLIKKISDMHLFDKGWNAAREREPEEDRRHPEGREAHALAG